VPLADLRYVVVSYRGFDGADHTGELVVAASVAGTVTEVFRDLYDSGYPIASMKDDQPAASVAAALFGEGMSSPLMNEIRERRGLVYYAACSADVMEACGQFVIEASTTPDKVEELLRETHRLLQSHAASVGQVDLERARNQIAVRRMRSQERPVRRVEDAALDLFVHGRVRSPEA